MARLPDLLTGEVDLLERRLAEATPSPGEFARIGNDLWWYRIALNFPPNEVNVWAFGPPDDITLIDTGFNLPNVHDGLARFISALPGPVRRVFVTHHHADHIGNAGWLSRNYGLPVYMGRLEWMMARVEQLATFEAQIANLRRFFASCAVPEEFMQVIETQRRPMYHTSSDLPLNYHPIQNRERFSTGAAEWEIREYGGHSPAQHLYWNAQGRILFGSDHVLPRIAPFVGIHPDEPDADPVADYLDSLADLRGLPAETLVLPCHGLPFRVLHDRLGRLSWHHEYRISKAEAACRDQPVSAFAVAKRVINRPIDKVSVWAAVRNVQAYLNNLCNRQRIRSIRQQDGTLAYIAA
ncbi:MBL fold metallo-hydrolase [Paracoccus pantotrophus]|uniref:MBL fold metallo-hydrolase n=1 Tax=Paracoccus pantotrophus TaxID=82367 RepID=UPI00048D8B22|nr:MBL fold metallo-hydrolase [Paracoccus pantotrophus]